MKNWAAGLTDMSLQTQDSQTKLIPPGADDPTLWEAKQRLVELREELQVLAEEKKSASDRGDGAHFSRILGQIADVKARHDAALRQVLASRISEIERRLPVARDHVALLESNLQDARKRLAVIR